MAELLTAVSAPPVISSGMVFDIQRCSIHDGPGVRTTAFLKGCPLHCSWCHNPEGIDPAAELMITADRCLVCHACTEVCPIGDRGAAPAGQPWNRNACVGCGSCVDVCPADARELMGREYGVEELVDRVERDRVFFEVSGGGVTFSGGEPLHQPDFLVACLNLCRERGLHTAVDTCGLAPPGVVLEVAGLTDLVLFDLKHMDPEIHRHHTGADNILILENLRALSMSGAEIWVRIPVIPGINDDDANLEATGDFLASLPRPHPVHLLPYHDMAVGKRARLGETVSTAGFGASEKVTPMAAAGLLARHGLEVTFGGSS